jgi:hypothetical protein
VIPMTDCVNCGHGIRLFYGEGYTNAAGNVICFSKVWHGRILGFCGCLQPDIPKQEKERPIRRPKNIMDTTIDISNIW